MRVVEPVGGFSRAMMLFSSAEVLGVGGGVGLCGGDRAGDSGSGERAGEQRESGPREAGPAGTPRGANGWLHGGLGLLSRAPSGLRWIGLGRAGRRPAPNEAGLRERLRVGFFDDRGVASERIVLCAEVASRLRTLRVLEEVGGRAGLDEPSLVEEDRVVRDPPRLRQVVSHDDHREARREPLDELLHRFGRPRVERGGRLVEQKDLWLDGKCAGQAEKLLLAPGEAEGRVAEAVRDAAPQSDLGKARLGDVPQIRARCAMRCAFTPTTTLSRIDIGKGFGRWKTIPTRRRSTSGSTSRMLSSKRRIVPCIQNSRTRSFIRLSERRKVVLPEPEGPTSAVIEPRGMSTVMSCMIVAEPNPSSTSSADMMFVCSVSTVVISPDRPGGAAVGAVHFETITATAELRRNCR